MGDGNGVSGATEVSLATIAGRLERLPLTGYQRTLFLIIATAWFFDSIDLGSLTFVLGSIRSEFGPSAPQTGLLSSMSFVGMFFGAAIAGMAADRYGRTLVFQVSMIFWGMGGLACSFAPSVTALGAARALLGFGMGMEFPVAQSIVSEIIPARLRGRYLALLEGFWPLGFNAVNRGHEKRSGAQKAVHKGTFVKDAAVYHDANGERDKAIGQHAIRREGRFVQPAQSSMHDLRS